jgi:hypothetical protein
MLSLLKKKIPLFLKKKKRKDFFSLQCFSGRVCSQVCALGCRAGHQVRVERALCPLFAPASLPACRHTHLPAMP